MKKFSFFFVGICICLFIPQLYAQNEQTVTLDLLQAPSSPGASLLGIGSSEIEKPSDPSAFMVSFQNATEDFTTLPKSYAIGFAPTWIFRGNKIDLDKFLSNSPKENIRQSFVISMATTTNSELTVPETQFALGAKISFFRGTVDSAFQKTLRQSSEILKMINSVNSQQVIDAQQRDSLYNAYFNTMKKLAREGKKGTPEYNAFQKLADYRAQEIKDSVFVVEQTKLAELKTIAEKMDFKRYGWKLDLSGGTAWNFTDQKFDSGTLMKAGAWLTGGYDGKDNVSFLGIARYLYNPKQVFADPKNLLHEDNIHTFDCGARLILGKEGLPFRLSGEVLYRSVLNRAEIDPSWRFTLNTEYKIDKNLLLSFVIGRDFDGTISKDGNLITALNLIKGFGTKKSLGKN